MCMYIYIYIYVCICIHTYVYVCIYIYIDRYVSWFSVGLRILAPRPNRPNNNSSIINLIIVSNPIIDVNNIIIV